MAKNTVQSVEPNIADLVNGWLKSYKVDYKLEQESLNTEIDQALNDYFSKNGGKGGNRPDAKLLLQANDGKYYPILIEYKGYKDKLVKLDAEGNVANRNAKNQPDYTNINSYAVNGAVHYSNAVLHYTSYTDVIAIGVTGYKDASGKLKHLIGVYYVAKSNFGVGQKVDEYKTSELFQPQKITNMLSKEDLSEKFNFPAYSSESTNNGIIGYTDSPEFICDDEHPVFVTFGDHTCSFNIATKSFSVLDNVKVLLPSIHNIRCLLWIITAWQKQIPNLGYARHWKIAKNCIVELPTKDGEIDFDFMESFVAELEAQRVAELSAYLTVSGYDNYELSAEELNALQRFTELDDDNWGTYTVGNLFEKIATKKLPYKAKELPKQPTDDYVLPCLTSSFQNQGLNYYAPKAGATVLNNVISIPSNSDVYRAYYQTRDFTVLSDAYAIRWKSEEIELSPNQYLFMVMCINKVTDLPIYSYKNKLGGWNVVKTKEIRLPEKNGKIDFAFMDTFISAIKKLAIKEVVLYSDRKIAATKELVSKNNQLNS